MSQNDIANMPAFPHKDHNGSTFGMTYHQWLVGKNVAAFANARPDQDDKDIVKWAIALADETCKQLAERSKE